MTLVYKLTDSQMQTYNNTQWEIGVTRTAPGGGPLCTDRWLHAYADPLLAMMLNPIHADLCDPRLFEAEAQIGVDDGCKLGCTSLTLKQEIPLPKITTSQRVTFGVLCALVVYAESAFTLWAYRWLSGVDRSAEAARAAAAEAEAARAAWAEAAAAAAEAAWAWAAWAWAARAAAAAAWAAVRGNRKIDLAALSAMAMVLEEGETKCG